MEIKSISPRPGWAQRVHDLGLFYLDNDGEPYWIEDRYLLLTQDEVEHIEAATLELHHLCLDAVETIIRRDWFDRMRIPAYMRPLIVQSWETAEPYIAGRFDFAFDGASLKMLEYNADTPAGGIEGSVIQWDWMESNRERGLLPADIDQFNGFDEAMRNAWQRAARHPRLRGPVWFATRDGDLEAEQNLVYMLDLAEQAGLEVGRIDLRDLGFDKRLNWFVDLVGLPIKTLYKQYEWEAMVREPFGAYLASGDTMFLEPCWKMLLSNKALLPILWELYEDHPNLLPAYFEEKPLLGRSRVHKPVFSMEGANISIVLETSRGTEIVSSQGHYGEEGFIWQAYQELPRVGESHFVVGSWIAGADPRYEGLPLHPRGGDPCGITIRTHPGLITEYFSRVMPHVYIPDDEDDA